MNPAVSRVVRSPRGSTISARSWLTEAPLRMLMNNLDPRWLSGRRPGGLRRIGRAARNWDSFERIVEPSGV